MHYLEYSEHRDVVGGGKEIVIDERIEGADEHDELAERRCIGIGSARFRPQNSNQTDAWSCDATKEIARGECALEWNESIHKIG